MVVCVLQYVSQWCGGDDYKQPPVTSSSRVHRLLWMLPLIKGADTPPTPTQNDLLVAMHMVYLVLLIVELFRYVDEQSTL